MNKQARLLIIDDSPLIRKIFSSIADADPDIEVVGTAEDPYDAREKIKRYSPNVLSLDVNMPKMDGVTFLKNLMRLRPMPVVMVSNATTQGAKVTIDALEAGAIDFLTKPALSDGFELEDYAQIFRRVLKEAANVNMEEKIKQLARLKNQSGHQVEMDFTLSDEVLTDGVIAIGASTGGTEAIKEILLSLPTGLPPIIITQHMPGTHSEPFIKRMDACSQLPVSAVEKRMTPLEPGHVYISHGDAHVRVKSVNGKYYLTPDGSDPMSMHRPSVDFMFQSVVNAEVKHVIAVVLTGMGHDGAEQARVLHDRGAVVIAQDQQTSVVWGMPRAVVEDKQAADYVEPLSKIPQKIINILKTF